MRFQLDSWLLAFQPINSIAKFIMRETLPANKEYSLTTSSNETTDPPGIFPKSIPFAAGAELFSPKESPKDTSDKEKSNRIVKYGK